MRNKYKGVCYFCRKEVLPNAGHFERYKGSWRTIHVECVFKQRKEKDKNTQYVDNVKEEMICLTEKRL